MAVQYEAAYLSQALAASHGNVLRAARAIGISRAAFYKKLVAHRAAGHGAGRHVGRQAQSVGRMARGNVWPIIVAVAADSVQPRCPWPCCRTRAARPRRETRGIMSGIIGHRARP
ncbi:helix-turn-helix domain-containing protein [Cupriavidus basilensis]